MVGTIDELESQGSLKTTYATPRKIPRKKKRSRSRSRSEQSAVDQASSLRRYQKSLPRP